MSDLNDTVTFFPNDLLSIIKLRTILKDFSSEQLETINSKIASIIEEVKLQEKTEREIEARKQAAINEIMELARAKGLSLEDLNPQLKANKPYRKVSGGKAHFEPKYSWTNEDGTTGYWSGQGAVPKNLRIIMERDGIMDKSAYLINKPETNE